MHKVGCRQISSSKTIIYTLFIKVIDKFLEDIYDYFGVIYYINHIGFLIFCGNILCQFCF